jgi:hypothetical protein
MFELQAARLLHNHGDGKYADMVESRDHDSADHDPERSWLRGARIFRCTSCADEIVLVPPTDEPADALSRSE